MAEETEHCGLVQNFVVSPTEMAAENIASTLLQSSSQTPVGAHTTNLFGRKRSVVNPYRVLIQSKKVSSQ